MVSDPRCPECSGKVSATATWCMHCGVDFDSPVDAGSGRPVRDRADQQADYQASAGDGDDATTAALVVAVFGLVTLPFVTPPNTFVFTVAAAVGAGLFAARQSSPRAAMARGGTAIAVAPVALWLLSPLLPGAGGSWLGSLTGPIAYAIVVGSIARQLD